MIHRLIIKSRVHLERLPSLFLRREIWPLSARFLPLPQPQEVICIPVHLSLSLSLPPSPLYRCVEFHLYRRKYLPCSAPIYSQICLMMPTERELNWVICGRGAHWGGRCTKGDKLRNAIGMSGFWPKDAVHLKGKLRVVALLRILWSYDVRFSGINHKINVAQWVG